MHAWESISREGRSWLRTTLAARDRRVVTKAGGRSGKSDGDERNRWMELFCEQTSSTVARGTMMGVSGTVRP